MATSKEKTFKTLTEKVNRGPGLETLHLTVSYLLAATNTNGRIHEFGNDYRIYPIRVTGIRIYTDETRVLLDIEGVLDFSNYMAPKDQSGSEVRVIGYSFFDRTGQKIEVVSDYKYLEAFTAKRNS